MVFQKVLKRKVRFKSSSFLLLLASLVFIGMFSFGIISNDDLINDSPEAIKDDSILRGAGFWSFTNITIDPLGGGNGTWTWAQGQSWCKGQGTYNNPYIIENITINAKYNHSGITIRNSNTAYFIIRNCTVRYSGAGLEKAGIRFINTNRGMISYCNCSSNQGFGIYWKNSKNNTISNVLSKNNTHGMVLNQTCDRNVIKNNIIHNNTQSGLVVLDRTNHTIITQNRIFNNTKNGILLQNKANNNTLSKNIIKQNNQSGIIIDNGDYNNITENSIDRNLKLGINISNSLLNLVYFNSFIKNAIHAKDDGISNRWNSTEIGNFWDNYTGMDIDPFDGVGDTSFAGINGTAHSLDHFPLINTPLFNGSRIKIDDNGVSALNWSRTATVYTWCNGSGTIEDPYLLKDLEIDGNNKDSCIKIGNSSLPIIIQNCKLYDSNTAFPKNGGIHLKNVSNAKILDSNCSNNKGNGIFIENNCTNNIIQGCQLSHNDLRGIYILGASNNNLLYNNRIHDNVLEGIWINNKCENNNITNNRVFNNSNQGILVENFSNLTRIVSNIVRENNIHGIYITDHCTENTISSNYIYDNGNNGVYLLQLCNRNTIFNNTVIYNANGGPIEAGIALETSCNNNTIYKNNASFNNQYGIYLKSSCSRNNLTENTVSFNNQDGIRIEDSTDNNISKNSCFKNSKDGINIFTNSYRNRVINNLVKNNTRHGIDIQEGSMNNTIDDNDVLNNTLNGINIYDSYNNTVSNNYIYNNQQNGTRVIFRGKNNTIRDNIILNNSINGIYLVDQCKDNVFFENYIKYHMRSGAYIFDGNSERNLFYRNRFIGNTLHAQDESDSKDNYWNSSTIGNYWDNYTGVDDSPSDGIGDTPYTFIRGIAKANDSLPMWDDDAPQITIISPITNDNFKQNAPNFTIQVIEPHIELMWYTIDGGLHNYTFTEFTVQINAAAWTAKSEGDITLTIYVKDLGNYISSQSVLIIKDIKVPVINIVSPASGTYFPKGAVKFDFDVVEAHLASMWYSINNGATYNVLSQSNGTIQRPIWGNLTEGQHVIWIKVVDKAGNEALNSISIYKDTIGPQINATLPLPGSSHRNQAPLYKVNIKESNPYTMWYTFDEGDTITYFIQKDSRIDQIVWNHLPDDNYTLQFFIQDAAGNTNYTSIAIEKQLRIPQEEGGELDPIITNANAMTFIVLMTLISVGLSVSVLYAIYLYLKSMR